jgi:SPP1 gp7 family putative phage head morphogenesis protein
MPQPPPPSKAPAAIAWLKDQVGLSEPAADAFARQTQRQALTIAGAASAQLVADVSDALLRALRDGTTLGDFKASVVQSLTAAWLGTKTDPPSRLETLFRTVTQTAYNAGRYEQATEPDTLAARPYWQFDAVLDGRTTSGCKRANGVVLPADDPWWQRNMPPRHFNCRATFHPLRASHAERLGITRKPPAVVAEEGFGSPPA